MCSDQPLVCCICARDFFANAGGVRGHRFREGVCGFECHLRKTWRETRSVLGAKWNREAELAYVEHAAGALTDEEHERDHDAFLAGLHAKMRSL